MTYTEGRSCIGSCVRLLVSGGARIGPVITHRREEFEENYQKVTGEENQEICGGIVNDIVEEARHTVGTHNTSMSR